MIVVWMLEAHEKRLARANVAPSVCYVTYCVASDMRFDKLMFSHFTDLKHKIGYAMGSESDNGFVTEQYGRGSFVDP